MENRHGGQWKTGQKRIDEILKGPIREGFVVRLPYDFGRNSTL